jgi:hypothetical protein
MTQAADTTIEEAATETIGEQRRRLERQLADLRRARGKAILDGRSFDASRITAVENQLAALDDADAVADEADQATREDARQAHYDAALTAFTAGRDRRIAAAKAAEVSCRAFADDLAEMFAATDAERAAAETLARATGSNGPPAELVEANVANRISGYVRSVLRGRLGFRFLGEMSLSPLPEDLAPQDPWAPAEERHADVAAYFARQRPA